MYVYRTVPSKPSIRVDREWSKKCGNAWVAGVDEAGRGPLAGPVVAAAVILPFDGRRPRGLRDSKELSAKTRKRLFRQIKRMAVSYGIGVATAQEIDLLNILEATRLAAKRALDQLNPQPEALVTDALELPFDQRPVMPLVKGDRISASISAASILAKVTRDELMDFYHDEFPDYSWDTNRGYPTAGHYKALERHGPTTLHRMTFQGVGFFSIEPRCSRTFLEFRERISMLAPGNGTIDECEVIRQELAKLTERLPPPDFEHLMEMLDKIPEGILKQ